MHIVFFFRIMRNWWRAVDKKGEKSSDRVIWLLEMRSWLLEQLRPKLASFPPVSTHINSVPIKNLEGLLISCERVIQLYQYSPNGFFNMRALGSMLCETFFR